MPFTPASLTNVLFYMQAETLGDEADNSLISQWIDSSGNGRHAVQATGAAQPRIRKQVLGQLPSVEWDQAETDSLVVPTIAHGIGGGELSMWFLVRSSDILRNYRTLFGFGVDAWGLTVHQGKVNFLLNNVDHIGATVMDVRRWYVIVVTRTAAGLITYYIDGVADANTFTDTASLPESTVTIGADGYGFEQLVGQIADCGFMNRRLTSTERSDLTTYLLARKNQTLQWVATLETADLTQFATNGYDGNVEDDGGVLAHAASTDYAHSGSRSLKLGIDTSGGQMGARQFRQYESKLGDDAYYSGWLYMPTALVPSSGANFLSIFEFKTVDGLGFNERFWAILVDTNRRLSLNWRANSGVAGPQSGDPSNTEKIYTNAAATIPLATWTHIEVYLKQASDFTGRITVYMNDTQMFDVNNCKTKKSGGGTENQRWAVILYSNGMSPSSGYIYWDDLAVSTTRLGIAGSNAQVATPTVAEAESRSSDALVQVDWTDNGLYSDTGDDVTDVVRHRPGISVQRGKDSVRPRAQPMVPAGQFVLGNTSRDYSAENPSSPIYGYVAPDRPVRVSMLRDGSPVTRLLTGLIDEPEQLPSITEQSVLIRVFGKTALLRGQSISTPLYSQIRTDEAIGYVLDAVGWPALDRVISTGDTILEWWWLDEEDAFDALLALVETEGTGASLYEDGAGLLHFESRNYRNMADRSRDSQCTFAEQSSGSDIGYVNFNYVAMMREIYNTVTLTRKHREAQPSAAVWTHGKPLSLSANESRTVFATGSDPWDDVQNVTVTTDYVVQVGSISSVTTSVVSATKVALTFVAGSSGATLLGPANDTSGPQLRAQAVTVVEEVLESKTSVGSVVVRPRTLSLTDKVRQEVSYGFADAIITAALNFYNEARPAISIEIINATAEHLDQILDREVSDRVTIVEPVTGVDRDIHIEQINHQVLRGGLEHRCAIIGSAAPDVADPALWGDTTYGGWGDGNWAN